MTFDAMHTCGQRSKVRQGMRALQAAAIALAIGGSLTSPVFAAEQADPWPELARDIFNGRDLKDGAGLIAIEMPYRAEDAAIVPVTLRATLPAGDARAVKAITLVIDQNPAPVAATFRIGAGVTMISTRVRVDSYTNVHAVAELSDGELYGEFGADAVSAVCQACRRSDERPARSADHDPPSQQFRPTARSGHAAVRPGVFRQGTACLARR